MINICCLPSRMAYFTARSQGVAWVWNADNYCFQKYDTGEYAITQSFVGHTSIAGILVATTYYYYHYHYHYHYHHYYDYYYDDDYYYQTPVITQAKPLRIKFLHEVELCGTNEARQYFPNRI